LVGFVVLILLLAVAIGFSILEAPWAYPLFGRPTLTGHWLGTFTTPSGVHFTLYLEVDHSLLTSGSSRMNGELFNGHGRWCDDRGRRAEDNLMSGSVPMFAGYRGSIEPVRMHLEPVTPLPVGLVPANLHGQWHLDTLTLIPDLAYWTGKGYQTSSANPDQNRPITVNLRKAEVEAFELLCVRRSG
jgi:hypothetical protein